MKKRKRREVMAAREFYSGDKTESGESLASGIFINFAQFGDNDLDNKKHEILIDSVRHLKEFKAPYMIVDLASIHDIELFVDNESYNEEEDYTDVEEFMTKSAKENPALKILASAIEIVDLTSISNAVGMSVVKCNPAFPVYRWFQAANLILKHCDQKGRVIPFPISQGKEKEEMMTFHMLRVDPREFAEYQTLLEFCTKEHGVEKGFEIASKYSYEALKERGIKELTSDQVDSTLTHVILMKDAKIRGVLLHNAGREDLDDEDLRKSHFIYY